MDTINLTQFIHPHGNKRKTWVDGVPDNVCEMAKSQILSCECQANDYSKVIFYSHQAEGWDEDTMNEEIELAVNGPGENSPRDALIKLIRRVHALQRDRSGIERRSDES